MHELYELVLKEEVEVWSPVKEIGAVMPLNGDPQVGDFMVVHGDTNVFMCRECTRVKIKTLNAGELQFEVERGQPNWLNQAVQAIKFTPRGAFFSGRELKQGDYLVFDGRVISVETPNEVAKNN